ncbi:MAG: oxygenase MpaB family protein [Pseudonocardia sp.]
MGGGIVGHKDGYFPPGSATRRVIDDPAALIGGFSALFLQALHSRAMAGVDQHSNFPDDFWPRPQRTAGYVTTVAFADTVTADRAVAHVRGIHRRVRGIDPVTGQLLGRRSRAGLPQPRGTSALTDLATTAGLATLRGLLLGVRRARGLPAPPL